MRNLFVFLLLANLLIGCKKNSKPPTTTTNPPPTNPPPIEGYSTPKTYPNMTSVWADEFDGTTLNTSYWNFETGNGCPYVCGWGNNELEFYKAENTKVESGYLVIA